MKKLLFTLMTGVTTILFSIPAAAQQTTVWGDYLSGKDGLTIGSKDDNTYSALVINGPNIPFYEANKRDIVFKFRAAGTSHIRALRGGSWGTFLQFMTTGEDLQDPIVRMHIDEHGLVGINTTNPSHTLTVNGTIRSKEILVDVKAGADHVFHPEYALKELSEVKSYIDENKHLPDIPSESQMQKEGLNVNEFQIKLLQKIEELTLYVIQLKSEIDSMNKNK